MLQQQSCDYYYEIFAHYSSHEDIIKDRVRMNAYIRAIQQNPSLFKGKAVLDAGTGTGIMALLAAKAGARVVYAVERTLMAKFAEKIVQINGFSPIIKVIHGDLTEVELPEKVDIIISDWMGTCLFADSSLEPIIIARDKWLASDGVMFPSKARIVIGGIEDAEYRKKKIDFWDDVYGFKFNCIKKWALVEPLVERCPTDGFLTDEAIIAEYDLKTITIEDTIAPHHFELVPSETNDMHAFVVWFDVFFKGPEKSFVLSTSPYCKDTIWHQCIFYLHEPLAIVPGSLIEGDFQQQHDSSNIRNQIFHFVVNYDGNEFQVHYKLSV